MDHGHHPDHSQHQHHAAKETVHKHHQSNTTQSEQAQNHVHDKHAGHHTADFLKRFWTCLILTIPVLLLSRMIQHWFGFHISFTGDEYVSLGLGSVIYFYGGWPFLAGMISEISDRAIGMMTLAD